MDRIVLPNLLCGGVDVTVLPGNLAFRAYQTAYRTRSPVVEAVGTLLFVLTKPPTAPEAQWLRRWEPCFSCLPGCLPQLANRPAWGRPGCAHTQLVLPAKWGTRPQTVTRQGCSAASHLWGDAAAGGLWNPPPQFREGGHPCRRPGGRGSRRPRTQSHLGGFPYPISPFRRPIRGWVWQTYQKQCQYWRFPLPNLHLTSKKARLGMANLQ